MIESNFVSLERGERTVDLVTIEYNGVLENKR